MTIIQSQRSHAMDQERASSDSLYSPITPRDLEAHSIFPTRHIGPRDHDGLAMLQSIGLNSMDALIDEVVPSDIRLDGTLDLPEASTEYTLWHELRETAEKNKVYRSCIGMGYVGTNTPGVILRNVMEKDRKSNV